MSSELKVLPPLTPDDFSIRWDENTTYSFVESEDGLIMAYGHQGKEDFAKLVYQYDFKNDPKYAEMHEVSDIQHLWAVRTAPPSGAEEDGWWMSWKNVTKDTAQAFPITLIVR